MQEQVVATFLDPRNMPDLNCIAPVQQDQSLALLRTMVIPVIHEVKNSSGFRATNVGFASTAGSLARGHQRLRSSSCIRAAGAARQRV